MTAGIRYQTNKTGSMVDTQTVPNSITSLQTRCNLCLDDSGFTSTHSKDDTSALHSRRVTSWLHSHSKQGFMALQLSMVNK